MFGRSRHIVMGFAAAAPVGFMITADHNKRHAHAAGWFGFGGPNIEAVKKDIVAAIEAEDKRRDDGTSIGPTLVRLAWHSCGTYSAADKTGGGNGATMRFEPESKWGANAGLFDARSFLEPIAKKHSLSQADTWTLAGVTAIEHMGGPKIAWSAGRKDSDKPTTVPDGRLPNADMGTDDKMIAHLRAIFGRMGFTDREIVALAGAHALGRCHTNASGYWGPWTRAETTFSNEYFRLLVEEKWTLKTKHQGKPWTGPKQFEDKTGELMMLPSDLAMLSDPEFKKWVTLYAKDEDAFFADFSSAFAKLMAFGL